MLDATAAGRELVGHSIHTKWTGRECVRACSPSRAKGMGCRRSHSRALNERPSAFLGIGVYPAEPDVSISATAAGDMAFS